MLLRTAARISWRLARVGVRITPYYWYREGFYVEALPPLEGETDYSFGFLDAADLRALAANDPAAFPEDRLAELLERLRGGRQCFGAMFRDQIIAMTSIDLDRATYLGRSIPLAAHEVYLGDMFTRQEFRGRNIAPHLRQRACRELQAVGKTSFYSFSEAFNPAAVRFKEKLGAKVLWLGLHVEIFGRYGWHWKLREYAC